MGRQIGAKVQADPAHHLIAGLLVEGVWSWPEDEQTVGVNSGVHQLVFPQGNGRVRLYLCYALEERGRFSGPDAARNFLDAFRVPTIPRADDIADGRIAGPCQGYPNADTWVDDPAAPGVVLIGDAAGHNDPTIGQGLSIAMRDVRLVAEALSATDDWGEGLFADYAAERRERMRRLRFAGRLAAKIRCEFGEEGNRLRAEVGRRLAVNPRAGLPAVTSLVGPWAQPADTFSDAAIKNLLGDNWSLTADGWFHQAPAGDRPVATV